MALLSYGNQVNQKPSVLDKIILQGLHKTPFLDWCGRGKMTGPIDSWIQDRYADAKANSNLEITDIEEDTTDTKYMKSNIAQIIKSEYGMSEEEMQNAKYGQQEWPFRTAKVGKEHAKDIEYAMLGLHNTSVFDGYTTGTATIPSLMAGIFHFVPPEHRQDFDVAGDGSGAAQTFTMDMLSDLIEPLWQRGALDDESFTMVVGPTIKRTINGFAGDVFFRRVKDEKKFDPTLYEIETDFGNVKVKIHRLFADPKLAEKVFVGNLNKISLMNKIATKFTQPPTSKTAKFGRYYTSCSIRMEEDDYFGCASGLK